ncbi:calcium/proton exchanger [Lactarius deliciosus]|nr:calcium/proton exchanger [Lactarius deliciosus]
MNGRRPSVSATLNLIVTPRCSCASHCTRRFCNKVPLPSSTYEAIVSSYFLSMPDLVRRLRQSSSEEQLLARGTAQPISEQTHSGAGSLAQKLKRKILGISTNLPEQFRPPKRFKEAPSLTESLKAVIKKENRSRWDILLIFLIPWLICRLVGVDEIVIFYLSFLAIIPLPRIQCIAANEVSMRAGSLSVLIDIILKHMVELIFTIQGFARCELTIAQSNLVGSIISKLLPTLGISIFIGGMGVSEQIFGMVSAQIYTSLLMLGVAALLIPTLLYKAIKSATTGGVDSTTDTKAGSHIVLAVGHGVMVILLFTFVCFQIFQRVSHQNIWGDNDPTTQKAVEYTPQIRRMLNIVLRKRTVTGTTSDTTTNPHPTSTDSDEGQDEKPQMHFIVAMAILALTFMAIFFISESLFTTVDDFASDINLNQEFVVLILFPFLGNVEDIKSTISASLNDRPREALAVAVGSSIETALFVFPSTSIVAWVLHKPPLPLVFDTLEAVFLFLSVLIVNYVVQDGRSNWLEGMILMCTYLIFTIMSFFYPGSDLAGDIVSCE